MITEVNEATSSEEFSEFIDDAFVSMCRSRNKVKWKVEYDDEKHIIIFHYTDGTADKVEITPVEGHTPPTEEFIKTGKDTYTKINKN